MVANSTDLVSRTFDGYLVDCLAYFVVQVSVLNQTGAWDPPFLEKLYEPNTYGDFQVLANLPVLTRFRMMLGYAQKSPNQSQVFSYEQLFSSCFPPPPPVQNLSSMCLQDGSLLLTWNEPKQVDPLRTCWFEVTGINSDDNFFIYTIRNPRLMIPKADVNMPVSLNVSAVNSVDCYQRQYPFARSCQPAVLKSSPQPLNFGLEVAVNESNGTNRTNHAQLLGQGFDGQFTLFFYLVLMAFAILTLDL